MIKILVSSEREREELLQASKHIHDSDVDTDLPMVNTIAHLYQADWIIEVDRNMRDGRS